jgi:sugar/nucleoside kinase (ribokinase family)
MSTRYDVAALGNAILDILAQVDDGFLARHGIERGAMTLVDEARSAALYNALPATRIEASGGSAGNTVAGIRSLGGRAAFLGKVAADANGATYVADMRQAGVDFFGSPLTGGPATATSMIAVTPDGERSMNTFLGASTEFAPEDVERAAIEDAGWLYLEGYLFDKPAARDAFVHASEIAQAAGRRIALTLSDTFCVDRHRASFLHLIRTHADLVFANERELLSLYETDDFDAALAAIRADSQIAAVTRSALGSVVVSADSTIEEAAQPVARVVDATGAGDQYAAGFLFGLTHGGDLRRCARLGHLAAAEVITHIGPRPAVSLRALAREAGLLDGLRDGAPA